MRKVASIPQVTLSLWPGYSARNNESSGVTYTSDSGCAKPNLEMMMRQFSRLGYMLLIAWALCLVTLTSCGATYSGSLRAGMPPGDEYVVVGDERPTDGRSVVFPFITIHSDSLSESITVTGVSMLGANGLEIVEAFTAPITSDFGGPVPPLVTDYGDVVNGELHVQSWEERVPLEESVVEPKGSRKLWIVCRPTSNDSCVYATGFRVSYEQNGRKYTADSNTAVFLYMEDDPKFCGDVVESILN